MTTPPNQAVIDNLLQNLCEWNERYNHSLRRNDGYETRKKMRTYIQALEQEIIIKLKQQGLYRPGANRPAI